MTRYPEYDVRGRDIPRGLFPSGRIRFSLGTSRGAAGIRDRMNDLREWGAWDVLRAIADGRLHPRTVAQQVRRLGQRAVEEIRQQLAADAAGRIPTFREAAEQYLAWYAERRRARSLIQVRSRLSRLSSQVVRPDGTALGDIPIDAVTADDIDAAVRRISPVGTTQESLRLAASGLYTWSIHHEEEQARAAKRLPRWTVNPAARVEPRERSRRVTTLPEDAVLRLLAAAEPYQQAYLRAFLHLGLRRGELIHTRLHDDLDVRDWIWRIQGRPPDPRCGCPSCRSDRGWQPKSRRSRRVLLVPEVPEQLRAAITEYLRLHPAEPGDFVFRNPRTGEVWSESRLEEDFETLCRRAGVRYGARAPGGVTLHSLRHTCATELVRRKVRESIIAGLLGDTVQTIVSTYIHLTPEDLAAAVAQGPSYAP